MASPLPLAALTVLVVVGRFSSGEPLTTTYKVLPKWCPVLANGGPVLDFVEGVTMTDGPSSGGVYSCGKILECRVQVSPPDVDISWERNGQVVGSASVRDITMARRGTAENDNRTFLAIAELVHRICIDSLPENHQHPLLAHFAPNQFQCQAKSVCDAESPAIESAPVAVSKRDVPHNSIKRLVGRWHSAPLITLITSTRMELAGHFVQLMCRASGSPSPSIRWSILDDETGREFPVRGARLPFAWVAENGDLLVDTSKTNVASLNFVCRAVNSFGADEQTSTLILLKEEEGGQDAGSDSP